MSGGDNINNIKAMFDREHSYINGLETIRNELKDILEQPLRFSENSIRGLIDYIGDLLNE